MKLGVIGAGQMGQGIAQVAASSGIEVTMVDISEAALQKGLAAIGQSCDRLIKKATMTEEEKKLLLGRIKTGTQMQSCESSDIVVEAATEN